MDGPTSSGQCSCGSCQISSKPPSSPEAAPAWSCSTTSAARCTPASMWVGAWGSGGHRAGIGAEGLRRARSGPHARPLVAGRPSLAADQRLTKSRARSFSSWRGARGELRWRPAMASSTRCRRVAFGGRPRFLFSWCGGGRRPELMSAQAAMRSAVRSCASCGEARDPALSG